MAVETGIQWTDSTWNPVVGCSRVSSGCANCYAVNHVKRMAGNPNAKVSAANKGLVRTLSNGKLDWTGDIRQIPERLNQPLTMGKPRLIFVNSLSDLFHEGVGEKVIQKIFCKMRQASQHLFQVLTKPSERLLELSPRIDWPENVLMGVSVEGARYIYRVENLRWTGAKKKFLSLEPLLGPIPNLPLQGIDWVIVGGESGKGARPLDLAWVRDIRDQCQAANVPLFIKQLGSIWAKKNGAHHKKGGDIEEWPEDLRIRQTPAGMIVKKG